MTSGGLAASPRLASPRPGPSRPGPAAQAQAGRLASGQCCALGGLPGGRRLLSTALGGSWAEQREGRWPKERPRLGADKPASCPPRGHCGRAQGSGQPAAGAPPSAHGEMTPSDRGGGAAPSRETVPTLAARSGAGVPRHYGRSTGPLPASLTGR